MKQIKTNKAPLPVGPYSQAVNLNNLIFCSGQIGINPQTGLLIEGGIVEESKQVLKNLSEVLSEAGSNLTKVVRVDIFLTNLDEFKQLNEIYAQYFSNTPQPARQTVEVSALPLKAKVEISCIAYK